MRPLPSGIEASATPPSIAATRPSVATTENMRRDVRRSRRVHMGPPLLPATTGRIARSRGSGWPGALWFRRTLDPRVLSSQSRLLTAVLEVFIEEVAGPAREE